MDIRLRYRLLFDIKFSDLIRAVFFRNFFERLLSLKELSEFHLSLAEYNHSLTFVVSHCLSRKSSSLCESLQLCDSTIGIVYACIYFILFIRLECLNL
jgi:hypothetical protein